METHRNNVANPQPPSTESDDNDELEGVKAYLQRWGVEAKKKPLPVPARSKHRRKLVLQVKRYGLSTDTIVAEYHATKTPPWVKRRKNRAANKVARRARRVNRQRGHA